MIKYKKISKTYYFYLRSPLFNPKHWVLLNNILNKNCVRAISSSFILQQIPSPPPSLEYMVSEFRGFFKNILEIFLLNEGFTKILGLYGPIFKRNRGKR